MRFIFNELSAIGYLERFKNLLTIRNGTLYFAPVLNAADRHNIAHCIEKLGGSCESKKTCVIVSPLSARLIVKKLIEGGIEFDNPELAEFGKK